VVEDLSGCKVLEANGVDPTLGLVVTRRSRRWTTGSDVAEPLPGALARERERFLSTGGSLARVRPEISSSWRRCLSWAVPPEGIDPPYRPDLDRESRLLRAAAPVLDGLNERLGEIGISVILTDADACILDRRAQFRRLLHALDSRKAAPGFVFAEDAVGTNGLGTAVELGRTTRIDGHEHFMADLTAFTCVGVPLVDPITRRSLGVLDVTCVADENNTLVTLLAEQTAREIQSRLVEQHSLVERALLNRFLAAGRQHHSGVVVLNERIIMANPQAARLLAGADHAVLWDFAGRVAGGSDVTDGELVLADGRCVRARASAVRDGGELIGAMLVLRCETDRRARSLERPAAVPARGGRSRHRVPPVLAALRGPGVVGSDPDVLEAHSAVRDALPGRILGVYGEPGVGKATLVRDVQPGRAAPSELDAAAAQLDGADAWLDQARCTLSGDAGTLLVRHAELLTATAARRLAGLLTTAADRGWVCAVTITVGAHGRWGGVLSDLDHERIWVPPLRDRLGDVPALVAAFAAPRRVAPEVMQLLQRLSWPGNVRELRSVVHRIVATMPPGGRAGLAHVPVDVTRSAARRPLTRFERAEVHAIVDALAETGGNKKDAAALLGISRSTLYRKLQAVGIDLENTLY
jgi:transcriptional regulator of acetoin/glycerol metabolism